MCGIIGYIGKNKCIEKIITGLENLEYRGYDSAGIAYITGEKIKIIKEKGKIINLKNKLDLNTIASAGIGHTRWATHGVASKTNAHPHKVGKFILVHNGIIENYMELKSFLTTKGYKFKSETDTEVACATIDYYYSLEKDILKAISKACSTFTGTYALGIICEDDLKHIYATKKTAPLIVASDESGNYIASDIPAVLNYTNKYILLLDNEICKLSDNELIVYDAKMQKINKKEQTYKEDAGAIEKNGFEHFMLKEIFEEDKIFKDTIDAYFDGTYSSLDKNFNILKKFTNIDIVACGSAYHAGLIGKYLFENYANIPVNAEIASEYRYKKCFYNKNTLVILISQSGETADTLAALRKAKNDGITTLAIVNVVDSTIAREADYTIYTKAGCEIAVATTKAYLSQITIFSLMTLYLMHIENDDLQKYYQEINKIPSYIRDILNNSNEYYKIADCIYKNKETFFIGRGNDYALSMEGSLKLKEISYINCVAYQAGELKHGTISLISKNTPVIAILTNELLKAKTISNIKEVKARNANIILVTNERPQDQIYDYLIEVKKTNALFQDVLTIIPLQLLAYRVAKNNNCDIDKPRNLAKSVTVE